MHARVGTSMYVYNINMHTHMQTHKHIMCVCMCECMHECVICMRACLYYIDPISIYVCAHLWMCQYSSMCTCRQFCSLACEGMYMKCVYPCVSIHVCVLSYVCLYVFECVFVYFHVSLLPSKQMTLYSADWCRQRVPYTAVQNSFGLHLLRGS